MQANSKPRPPANPQSLNRYSYVLNNPFKFIDPTGAICIWTDADGSMTADDPEAEGGDSEPTCLADGGSWFTESETVVVTPDGSEDSGVQPIWIFPILSLNTNLALGGSHGSSSCSLSLGQRASLFIQGTLNAGLGFEKQVTGTGGILVGVLGEPETAGASTVLVVSGTYTAVAGTGQTATGISQLQRAFTGNAEPETTFEQYAAIASGPFLGFGSLAAGASPDDAERYATEESIYTTGPGLINSGTASEIIHGMVDTALTLLGLPADSGGCQHP